MPKTQRVRTEQLKKQRLTRRVSQTMGRQRNNPQIKGKEEVSERMLNEIEPSQLSDTDFKAMVIKKVNKLTEITKNYRGTTINSLQIISTRKRKYKLSTRAKRK